MQKSVYSLFSRDIVMISIALAVTGFFAIYPLLQAVALHADPYSEANPPNGMNYISNYEFNASWTCLHPKSGRICFQRRDVGWGGLLLITP